MKRILITLLTCTCLYSCSKNDDGTTPDSRNESYKAGNVVTADEAVMYTNNGVAIHDQAIIKDYVTRRGVLSDYVFDKSTADASMFTAYTLEFSDAKHTVIGNTKAEIVDKSDSLILMAVLDSAVTPAGQKSWSDSLMDMVNKNGPLAECPSYYTDPCSYRKKYPLLIADSNYYIPYVVATITTNVMIPTQFGVSMDYSVYTHKRGETMLFDKSMVSKLGRTLPYVSGSLTYLLQSNDTLVVQTLRQKMVKQ
ncbi:hypothetical protein GO495_30085 [Chitinophaga oryziterrae]|uniref:Uncharacterized protein n=1 Tax=Chitinophaga oryziterrae TaxID=1031224 RepID=A0A6N8JKG9_9BACT|nr:hypothetical protein [Chitinophaga oryziterrae]MVT44879.1 hypothetical protein [Chitinophaga oryziterrae]